MLDDVHQAALLGRRPVLVSGRDDAKRTLFLTDPLIRGVDVESVQNVLQKAGFLKQVDGAFGQASDRAIRAFQKAKGLKIDGIVGPATRAALGL